MHDDTAIAGSQPFPSSNGALGTLSPKDLALFQRFRVPMELLAAAHVQRVSDFEAKDAFGIVYSGDKSGIVFPYYTGDRRRTARLRRDCPELDGSGKPLNKYISAYADHRHLYFPPRFEALISDPAVAIVLVESEKSVLAGTAWAQRTGSALVFVGLGGCWGWRGRIGKTEAANGSRVDVKGALPDLSVCDGRRVYVMFDANVLANPKVGSAEKALVAELRNRQCDVIVCRILVQDGINGPDDLLAIAGDDALAEVIAKAQPHDRPIAGESGDGFVVDQLQVQQAFTDRHGANLRYTVESGRWYQWNGHHYEHAAICVVFDLARAVCREISQRPENEKARSWIATPGAVTGVEKLGRGRVEHRISIAQWDADPWALNTPGGVVNLQTGTICQGRPEDLCIKTTSVAPLPGGHDPGSYPQWKGFLRRVTGGNGELESFLQRVAGYALTGITREHALFFFYGTGRNGKSTYVNAISGALGDYATTAPMATLIAADSERHPTELAGLQGARMVSVTETEEGRRWAESKLKTLTGGDKIATRFMRQDFFEYVPSFKLFIAGNHKPGLRSVDIAIRRRVHLIPFTVTIPADECDPALPEKLRQEWPAILTWMIAGCLEWQRSGLRPPKAVTDATDEYMASEDKIGRWIEDRCIEDRNQWIAVKDLFSNFTHWAEESGEHVGSLQKFSVALEGRGFAKERRGYIRGFLGLRLRP